MYLHKLLVGVALSCRCSAVRVLSSFNRENTVDQRTVTGVVNLEAWTTIDQRSWQRTSGKTRTGSRADFVTRLHRYDHSGIDVFFEREAEWLSGGTLGRSEGVSAGYVQLSRAQADELRRHHESEYEPDSVSAEPDRGSSLEVRLYSSGEEKSHMRHLRATTMLKQTVSQYLGRVGVGTALAPEGCSKQAILSRNETASTNPTKKRAVDGNGETQSCVSVEQSKLWVVFDTGSTNIWIASDLCDQGPCTFPGRTRYNHLLSNTFHHPEQNATLSVTFGTGKLKGPMAVDDMYIGPFPVRQQTFAMIQEQIGDVFSKTPMEGIVGLGFKSMSASPGPTFFDRVIAQKVLDRNQFAFYFNNKVPAANAVFWGGADSDFYEGDLESFPIVHPHYWSVELHAFKIGSKCLFGQASGCMFRENSGKPHVAIVDTGTTFFSGDEVLFPEIISRISSVSCVNITDETHPNLTFTLRNAAGNLRDIIFTNDMYMAWHDDVCLPTFMQVNIPKDHGPGMILGEVFLRRYFVVFDRGQHGRDEEAQVQMAPSVQTDKSIERLRVLTK